MDGNATIPGGTAASYVFALWNLVIRPPRARYELEQLGPAEFTVYGMRVSREDLRVTTVRGLTLECSHFKPRPVAGREDEPLPVVIYLHGNSSSRLEAREVMQELVSRRISLFCYDAAGCGLSEGEYISLGWHERDDLAAVIDHLRQSARCGAVGLWGRSMGAVTALLHADRDHSIGAMCIDSPFASMRQLVLELAQSEHMAIKVPTWLLNAALGLVRMRVRALADFDIDDLVPLEHVENSFVPALFIHGKDDIFVQPSHSQQIYNKYSGDKEMLYITGDHNSDRGRVVVARVVDFFCRAFRHDAFAEGLLPQEALPPASGIARDDAVPPVSEPVADVLREPIAPVAPPAPDMLKTHEDLEPETRRALAKHSDALTAALLRTVATPARAQVPIDDQESFRIAESAAFTYNMERTSRRVCLEERLEDAYEDEEADSEDSCDETEGISSEGTSCSSSNSVAGLGLMSESSGYGGTQLSPLGHSVTSGQLGPARRQHHARRSGKRSAKQNEGAPSAASSLVRSLSSRFTKCCMAGADEKPGPVVSCL